MKINEKICAFHQFGVVPLREEKKCGHLRMRKANRNSRESTQNDLLFNYRSPNHLEKLTQAS